jgi:ribulose-phosphate 3-epimerase
MVEVIPGIYESDPDEVIRKIERVAPFTSWIQIDLNDETLGGKPSLLDPIKLGEIIARFPKLSFEAHCMMADPQKIVRPLVEAGFKRIIAHIESSDPRLFLEEAEYESIEVGLAIDGPTELDQIEPFLETLDTVVVMAIEMGDSGKPFLPETIEKIKQIHETYPDLPIEIDGGMNEITARFVREAGATRIAATNFIFRNPSNTVEKAINLLAGK